MNASKLIKLIPDNIFRELAIKTGDNTQVKKLSGELMFKLILFSMLNSEKLSLRIMEEYLHSGQFKLITGYDVLEGKYNSIRDRICNIYADYFEQLFEKSSRSTTRNWGKKKCFRKQIAQWSASPPSYSVRVWNMATTKRSVS